MKKLVVIFGPPAVGKMTVGIELQKLTGIRLFHNHMTIEILLNFFEFGSEPFSRLRKLFRDEIFKAVAKSDLPGMVFTVMWELDEPHTYPIIDSWCEIFRQEGAEVYFVELYAELEERLRRNGTPLRLEHKASKRDVEASTTRLLKNHQRYQFNTTDGEFPFAKNFLRVDNTHLSPEAVAQQITRHFALI
ncbi:MAG: AAA family ATPase [Candidatus Promineifilaceae bacterium]